MGHSFLYDTLLVTLSSCVGMKCYNLKKAFESENYSQIYLLKYSVWRWNEDTFYSFGSDHGLLLYIKTEIFPLWNTMADKLKT